MRGIIQGKYTAHMRLAPALRSFLNAPLVNSLALSLSLHLALFVLLQPEGGNAGDKGVIVINARLGSAVAPAPAQLETPNEAPRETQPPPNKTTSLVEPTAEPRPQTAPQEKPAEAQPHTPLLLTSDVPSPATPLPIAPATAKPASAVPPQPAAAPVAALDATAPPPAGAAGTAGGEGGLPGIDPTWYRAREVDTTAKPIGSITPAYPDEARRRNKDGSLKLMLKIDDLGRVRDAEVVEADPPGLFEDAALEAFRAARFQPAMKDGRPVRYQAYIRVRFRLKDE